MRSKLFQAGPLASVAGGIMICCLGVSPVQSDPPSPALAHAWADSLYRDGLAALAREDWTTAVINFEDLQRLKPGYRDLSIQRALAWNKLETFRAAENKGSSDRHSKAAFYGGLGVVALFAAFTMVAASSQVRVSYRLWRGDDHGAARIYEKIIRNHPERGKFYPPLAGLYLRLGREDDTAMKLYKAILRLNLETPHRQEINTMLAKKYLANDFTEEKAITDDDAIPVLEEALRTIRIARPRLLQPPKRSMTKLVPSYF